MRRSQRKCYHPSLCWRAHLAPRLASASCAFASKWRRTLLSTSALKLSMRSPQACSPCLAAKSTEPYHGPAKAKAVAGNTPFSLSWEQEDLFPCGEWGSAPQTLGENKRRGGAGKAPLAKTRPWLNKRTGQTERTGQTGRVPRGIDPGKARRHAMAGWGKYSGRKPQRGNAGSPCCRPQFHGVCGGK